MNFYAHSGTLGNYSDWQLLADHLRQVAERASCLAQRALPGNEQLMKSAWVAGLLHDLGKYRNEFQEYICGFRCKGDPTTFHKQAGAAKAAQLNLIPIAYAIHGHHGGMPDREDLKVGVKSTAGLSLLPNIWPTALTDCTELSHIAIEAPQSRDHLHAELITRILFSCLVDADWGDTGEYERKRKGWPDEPKPTCLEPAQRIQQVIKFIQRCAINCKEHRIREIRDSILQACLVAANQARNVFTLTVPTGGGKTLASLSFALAHAAKHDMQRIIYVAPYMSILEQNISVFRSALGITNDSFDLFEHYSLAEPPCDEDQDDTRRQTASRRAENWDAPFIVTTNVQFFESLFSNNPGRCRKVHNIARSVVILDECQTLPPGLVAPTCAMLKQLVEDLGCSIVLCTATQPAFSHGKLQANERLDAIEIIPKELDLFRQLKRVRVIWPKENESTLSWSAVAERMCNQPSALCVVNTKKAALEIYQELKKSGNGGVFHLSTNMCPQHRREKLKQIKLRLHSDKPCYLVSTQLIEAGVDVDFPFLMREMAPLESIIQAAGRCNREGKLKDGGTVEVFQSVDGKMPPDAWYNAGRITLQSIIKYHGDGPQIDDPIAIQDYFSRLYHSGKLDVNGIQSLRETTQFQKVADAYKIIDNGGQPVVVAKWKAYEAEISELLVEVASQERPSKATMRKLARFQVNLLPSKVGQSQPFLHEIVPGVLVWNGDYDDESGILDQMSEVFVI